MTLQNESRRGRVMITSPLEPEHVERIAAVAPDRVDLIYRPDLLPPARYVADHNGPTGWTREPSAQAEWESLLASAEVLWDFAVTPGKTPLEASPNLKWVQTTSAGVGQYVKRLGVADTDLIVTTASGVHSGPLTEFVIAVLLYHEKRFPMLHERQATKHWERYCGGELTGKTIAIVGPGRIGREIGRIAHAFNMRVLAMPRTFDPARKAELHADEVFPPDQLEEMLGQADYVVLCTPHTPETEGMIGPRQIAAMKPGVVLVNIARGVVIDERAMIDALRSGHIGFAGLDVFETEPLPVDSPLWEMPNVLVNPHSASTAESENAKITDIFCHNLRCYVEGRYTEMTPVLDKQRYY